MIIQLEILGSAKNPVLLVMMTVVEILTDTLTL